MAPTKALFALVLVALVAGSAYADVYMHNPRGMNNRCDEQNNNRNNNNRLMNTQNNGAGGYPVAPSMYYHAGSILSLEWTQQHACGSSGLDHCEIVLQYSCSPDYKNGLPEDLTGETQSNTCTDQVTTANENDADVGRHESSTYFTSCNDRQRNQGLFTADENVNNNQGAQATRQNPGGNKSGFECQEERDYYPYWHPTPFRDIAVLTSNLTRCELYQTQSENVMIKHHCVESGTGTAANQRAANNEADCNAAQGTWTEEDAHGIDAPECIEAPWGRDNHLGATVGGNLPTYNWTIPDAGVAGEYCFVRLRYNVSSMDYDPWNGINAALNGDASPVLDDPYVAYGESGMVLRLAIDTNQFGRTFQDRSYTFTIKDAPDTLTSNKLWNLNVRGKRGNIAQVRNCVEYDFVPQVLQLQVGDLIHFQWTGSNFQPNGNAGEGRTKTDRHNLVSVKANSLSRSHFAYLDYENDGVDADGIATGVNNLFSDPEVRHTAAYIRQDNPAFIVTGQTECASYDSLVTGTTNNNDQNNCAKLNLAADANGVQTGYFNLGTFRMNATGEHAIMSTRNNNFTNRGQKATIQIATFLGYYGGQLAVLGIVAASVLVVGSVAFVGIVGVGVVATTLTIKNRDSGSVKRQGSRSSMNSGSSRRSGSSGSSAKSGSSRGSSRSKGTFGRSMI